MQLENWAQHCAFSDTNGPQELREIIHGIVALIRHDYQEYLNTGVISDVLHELQEAENYLDSFKPDTININDWKHNLQAFSKAKAHTLYPLNHLQAALRFGKLHAADDQLTQKNSHAALASY